MKHKTKLQCEARIRELMQEHLPEFSLLKDGAVDADNCLHYWAEVSDSCSLVVRFEFHNRFGWFTVSLGIVPDLTWIVPDPQFFEPSELLAAGGNVVGGQWVRLREVADPEDPQDRWWEIEELPALDASVDDWINRPLKVDHSEKVDEQVALAIKDLATFGAPFLREAALQCTSSSDTRDRDA